MKANFNKIWYPTSTDPEYKAIIALKSKIRAVLYVARRTKKDKNWNIWDIRCAEQRLVGALDTLCEIDMISINDADRIYRVVDATATKIKNNE